MHITSKQLFYHGAPVNLIPDDVSPMEYARTLALENSRDNRDDPFYVCDVGRLVHKNTEWKHAMPRVHAYYAVKCNNNPLILNILAQLGCNFDCASKAEIDQVLGCGVEANRIIFANPCKTASHIRHAAARGVRMMTFDNEQELYKVQRLHPEAELVLRIAVSDPTAICQLNMKFGCDPVSVAPSLLKLAAVLNVKVIGISFHVGSGARDPTAFAVGIGHARRLFNLGKELGHKMDILDVGGGYPGYENDDIKFSDIADTINGALDVHFPPSYDAHIIGEPGRFFAASGFLLCTNVIAKTRISADKITGQGADKDQNAYMYYVNDGVYGSFNCILFDHCTPAGHPLFPSNKNNGETWCSVWGPTCDSMDCIYKSYRMPELSVGDWMSFENMGAYTVAAASDFNGFQKTPINYIIRAADWEVLKKLAPWAVSDADAGCMSDDSGVPVTSDDDDTCSVTSSASPGSLSAAASIVNLDLVGL